MDKKYSLGSMIRAGTFKFNPVLIQCVGLFPVVAATQNLRDAFFASIALLADMIVTSFIASLMLKKAARFLRVGIYLIIGLLLICPALWFIEFKTLIDLPFGMRMFLPLIAVNSATAVHCETFAVKNDVRTAVYDAIASGIGIGAVMLICGAVREILGSGSILGRSLPFKVTLEGMAMPVGCLVILGFAAALLQTVYSGEKKPEKKPASDQPEEIELEVENVLDPEQIDMDFGFERDDEYDYLLSSVNELIESFTGNDGEKEESGK